MKNLTPEQVYWITLVGIFMCGIVIGGCLMKGFTEAILKNVGHDGEEDRS